MDSFRIRGLQGRRCWVMRLISEYGCHGARAKLLAVRGHLALGGYSGGTFFTRGYLITGY